MSWGFHDKRPEPSDESPPSEAWLFAQALLGNPVPHPAAAEAKARRERGHLEWLASISDRHRDELLRLQSAEAQAKHEREHLEWLAAISPRHALALQRLRATEAQADTAQARLERLFESLTLQEAGWDPSKHPRRGGAPNAGWFASTGGAGGGGGGGGRSAPTAAATPAIPPERPNASSARIIPVSSKGQQKGSAGTAPSTSENTIVTRIHVPAEHRGTWISGTKGNGTFRYNDSLENQQAGLASKEVRFANDHIAIGGLPAEMYYGGNASAAKVEIDQVIGTRADNRAADAKMREKLGDPNWRRPKGYLWNHAGSPGSTTMELVKEGAHERIAHKGPAAAPRALRRNTRTRGTTGRATGALTVYLTARDALQAAGILQPDYEVAERETYHFVADDGSVFVVRPGGLLFSAKREFVAGPRKGQTEEITSDEVERYRKQAEDEWGKYVPGSLLSEPRFIPGKRRKSLPLIEYRFGIPFEAGWIDEDGVHRYPAPKATIT